MHQKFLELINVGKSFTRGSTTTEVLKGVNLEIAKSQFVSVIGHSGCGKSTLLTMIAGLELPTAGSVCFKEREIEKPGQERAVVFQNHSLLPWRTVKENVLLAVNAVFTKDSKAQRLARAEKWLKKSVLRTTRTSSPTRFPAA